MAYGKFLCIVFFFRMFHYSANKTSFVQQRSDPGQDTDMLAIICSKFCTSQTLKNDYGIEKVDQLPGVQFLENLGHTQEQVVLLQTGKKNGAKKVSRGPHQNLKSPSFPVFCCWIFLPARNGATWRQQRISINKKECCFGGGGEVWKYLLNWNRIAEQCAKKCGQGIEKSDTVVYQVLFYFTRPIPSDTSLSTYTYSSAEGTRTPVPVFTI